MRHRLGFLVLFNNIQDGRGCLVRLYIRDVQLMFPDIWRLESSIMERVEKVILQNIFQDFHIS